MSIKLSNVLLLSSVVFLSLITFFTAQHNLDNLHNASLFINDYNMDICPKCNDLRDSADCTLVSSCPDYVTNYLRANLLLYSSYFILIFTIAVMGVYLWKKYQS